MARPVEFDFEKALCAAIDVFSSHGFEGSSTAELLSRMGIARQSLYGAFGDKRSLFLKALEHYSAASLSEFVTALKSGKDRFAALEAALLSFPKLGPKPEAGCLGLASVTEFGRSDAGINAINDASGRGFVDALKTHISDGAAAGEFDKVDPQEAAHFLLAVRSGLKTAARGGVGLKEQRAIVRMALRSLRR